MAGQAVGKVLQNNSTATTILAVGAVGLGAYVIIKTVGGISGVFEGIGNLFGIGDDDEQDQINKSNDRLGDLLSQGEKPSYTEAEYRNYANKLQTAIEGIGNDPQKIADVFDAMKNEVDVRKLNSAFGIKDGDNMNEWLQEDILNNVTTWSVELKSLGRKLSILQFYTPAGMVEEILRLKGIDYAV